MFLRSFKRVALTAFAVLLFADTAQAASPNAEAGIKAIALTDYLLYFFDGRKPPSTRYSKEWNWFDDAAMKLGVGTYAIHQGDRAVVYDTFTSVRQAQFVRDYLEKKGIKHFTVIHSHWHLDHIAGDTVYRDSDFIASEATREAMISQKKEIEGGSLWGPPPIDPVVLPNITFQDTATVYVGDIRLDLRRINIHSKDSTVVYIPKDQILLAGDTLEDTLTYMVEVENLAHHVENLKRMRTWDIKRIYPNHGDPDVIRNGGYDKTFIDATVEYVTGMLKHSHDKDFLSMKVEDVIGNALQRRWVHMFKPYRDVHEQNLKLVHDYWKGKPIPAF